MTTVKAAAFLIHAFHFVHAILLTVFALFCIYFHFRLLYVVDFHNINASKCCCLVSTQNVLVMWQLFLAFVSLFAQLSLCVVTMGYQALFIGDARTSSKMHQEGAARRKRHCTGISNWHQSSVPLRDAQTQGSSETGSWNARKQVNFRFTWNLHFPPSIQHLLLNLIYVYITVKG